MLTVEENGGVLHLKGELDIATEPQLTEALEPLVKGGEDVKLDLSGLDFIDSSGVRAIVRAAKGLPEPGKLILQEPGSAVQRVLDLMRLDTIPNVEVSRAQEA